MFSLLVILVGTEKVSASGNFSTTGNDAAIGNVLTAGNVCVHYWECYYTTENISTTGKGLYRQTYCLGHNPPHVPDAASLISKALYFSFRVSHQFPLMLLKN